MNELLSGHSPSQNPPANHAGAAILFGEVLTNVFPNRKVLGGAPFNVARHLKTFGLNPVLITRLGNDALRDQVAWHDAAKCHIDRDGNRIDVGVKKQAPNPVDTVGPGDGFAAICIPGALRQWPIPVTLERANAFAAAICEIRGTFPANTNFYQPFTEEWNL